MSADAGTWVGAIALAIPLAAAAAAAPRALWLLDQRRRHESTREHARAADREAMLGRVRSKWIDGILTPSMSHTERLALGTIRNGREDTQTPILQLFLYKASQGLTGIAEVDTGLKFLDKSTVVPYSSTKSRYEGTGTSPGVQKA